MSNSMNTLTKDERTLINKRATVLARGTYELYRGRLIDWAAQRKRETGQTITVDDLAQVAPDLTADLK